MRVICKWPPKFIFNNSQQDDKKMIRYRDGKIVSTKGERFTQVSKAESEEMKKSIVGSSSWQSAPGGCHHGFRTVPGPCASVTAKREGLPLQFCNPDGATCVCIPLLSVIQPLIRLVPSTLFHSLEVGSCYVSFSTSNSLSRLQFKCTRPSIR